MKNTWMAGIVVASTALAAQTNNVPIRNPGFESGLDGWSLRPGDPAMVALEPLGDDDGTALKLTAAGANLGINSAPLIFGKELAREHVYRVRARLRFDGLEKGVAAFSICAYDVNDRRIAQYAVQNWSTGSAPHDWITRGALIGPGTDKPFPQNAHAVRLRLSFYDQEGDARGTIWMDDASVSEETAPPATSAWPVSILVTADRLQIRFESRSFWTLYRIDYDDVRICKDQFGSHYGSVANLKGTGFVGSGHTENDETEQIDALSLEIDGKPVEKPADKYEAETVVLHKRSRIRSLSLDTTVTVADNRILEEVTMEAADPTDLNLIYHFMHPWVTEMSHYAGETVDGELVTGEFKGDKGMRIAAPVSWSAVFSETLQKGALTIVLDVPDDVPWNVRYWDVPKRYRKHYLMSFAGMTVPAGRPYRYRVLTIPFEADSPGWLTQARSMAAHVLSRQ